MIAIRLGRPGVVDNMFRQNMSLNRGVYRVYEGVAFKHLNGSAYDRATGWTEVS